MRSDWGTVEQNWGLGPELLFTCPKNHFHLFGSHVMLLTCDPAGPSSVIQFNSACLLSVLSFAPVSSRTVGPGELGIFFVGVTVYYQQVHFLSLTSLQACLLLDVLFPAILILMEEQKDCLYYCFQGRPNFGTGENRGGDNFYLFLIIPLFL